MASIKYGLMGPISGIGDTFIQAILSPLLLSMGLGLAIDGNLLGPVLYLVLFIGIILVLGYECYMLGYKKGDEAILNFIESGVIRKIISGAVYTGMKKKDISALKMMGILIVVGAVLGIIGLI